MVEVIESAKGMFSGALGVMANYWWVLIIILGVIFIFGIIYIISSIAHAKKQWTHKFIIKRKMADGTISPQILILKAKRFVDKDKKITKYFRLEKPLLGCNLIVDPGKYNGANEFSLILDEYNRIWVNEGEIFNPSKDSITVSARHAEIDLKMEDLTKTVQLANTFTKSRDWKEIAKTVIKFAIIIAVVIISIVALQEWSKVHDLKLKEAQANENAMSSLNDAMTTVQATVNTQQLEITFLLQKAYGTQNLQDWIGEYNRNMEAQNGTV